jgi:prepilin-type N-terminal cleavage/methylation domain-containing protein|tara:strand:+ start:1675 stop:2121 length:447 start_codon:yes stop_codon:yes gene_type:complete
MRNSNDGFTLAELVVSISLVGVLMSFAIPSYQSNVLATQRQSNITNMEIVRTTFMMYWQEGHMIGNPNFPPQPENNQMDLEFKAHLLPDGRMVNDLFSGDLPRNSNNNPFYYYVQSDTSETGFVTQVIIIVDEDEDSPSYEEEVIGEV